MGTLLSVEYVNLFKQAFQLRNPELKILEVNSSSAEVQHNAKATGMSWVEDK